MSPNWQFKIAHWGALRRHRLNDPVSVPLKRKTGKAWGVAFLNFLPRTEYEAGADLIDFQLFRFYPQSNFYNGWWQTP